LCGSENEKFNDNAVADVFWEVLIDFAAEISNTFKGLSIPLAQSSF